MEMITNAEMSRNLAFIKEQAARDRTILGAAKLSEIWKAIKLLQHEIAMACQYGGVSSDSPWKETGFAKVFQKQYPQYPLDIKTWTVEADYAKNGLAALLERVRNEPHKISHGDALAIQWLHANLCLTKDRATIKLAMRRITEQHNIQIINDKFVIVEPKDKR